MASKPTGHGLENKGLYERVLLGRVEANRLMKTKKSWNPDGGGKLPDNVLDEIYTRFGLDDLTPEEIAEIKIKDLTLHVNALVEHGKKMGWVSSEGKEG